MACSLTATQLRVRGEENDALFARALGAQELPDGYCFTFPARDEDARDLLQFILAKHACCPFFTFELAFPSPHQAISLTVRGSEGVKEIVRASMLVGYRDADGDTLRRGTDDATQEAQTVNKDHDEGV